MKSLTVKNLEAILKSKFGALTPKMHQLANAVLNESARTDEARDDARRATERVQEITRVRPEYERVLLLLTRPLGDSGFPAIEVYYDPRVKIKIAFEDDRLPKLWDDFRESVPVQQTDLFIIPDWLRTP